MNKLIFIYDKLMSKDEQDLLGLNLKFLTFAQINAKLYWMTDTKRIRYFAVLPKGYTVNLIYGGLFLLKDYEENKHKLHAYYNNSIPFTNYTTKDDIYDFVSVKITPIRFNNLKCIEMNNYAKGKRIECFSFIGNLNNNRISFNAKRKYYKIKGVDKFNFIKMIQNVQEGMVG